MNALGQSGGFLSVTRGALDFGDFCGVWELLDAGVTVLAAEDRMRACSVGLRANRYVVALFRFHACLAVTGEARFVLL